MLKNNKVDSLIELPNNLINEMLNEHFKDSEPTLKIKNDYTEGLCEKQKKAFELFVEGKNILMMGLSGSGKTTCIKRMEYYIKNENINKNIYLSATTGLASYSINGTTINSLLGIGTGDLDVNYLIRNISSKKIYSDRIKNMDILILDEISMLSANLFEKINTILQNIRKSKLLWGGIQIIFTGDFAQLEVVFNSNENIYKNQDKRLLFESPLFNSEFKKNDNVVILNVNHRQSKDDIFIQLLSRIRNNTYTPHDIELLNKYKRLPDNISNHVHLVCTNKKAEVINNQQLSKLNEKDYIYTTNVKSSTKIINEELSNLLIKELEYQFKQKGLLKLILKKGARVMLVKNLDISLGLVNGSIGTIIRFDGEYPVVLFDNYSKPLLITPSTWDIEIDNCKATSEQLPLILAYALNIHKAQGTTMSSAIMDLENAFCNHMVYTALSRLKTLDGLYLKSFNPSKITVNSKVEKYLKKFE